MTQQSVPKARRKPVATGGITEPADAAPEPTGVASSEPKPKPRWTKGFIRRWLGEEKFWQDVTTRTLAILISTPALAFAAMLLGVVQPYAPLVIFVALMMAAAGLLTISWRLSKYPRGSKQFWWRIGVAVVYLAVIVTALVIALRFV